MNACFDNHTRRVFLPPETVALFESLQVFSQLKPIYTKDDSGGTNEVGCNDTQCHESEPNDCTIDHASLPMVSKSCHITACDDSYCCIDAKYDCFVNLVDLYNYCSANAHMTAHSLVRTEQFVEWFSAVTRTHGQFADMFVLHTYLQGCKTYDHVFTYCFEQLLMHGDAALSNEHRTVNARHILGIEN